MLQIVASLTIIIDNASYSYEAKVKHIYSTDVIYDCHFRSSNYVYNTGHWWCHKKVRSIQSCFTTNVADQWYYIMLSTLSWRVVNSFDFVIWHVKTFFVKTSSDQFFLFLNEPDDVIKRSTAFYQIWWPMLQVNDIRLQCRHLVRESFFCYWMNLATLLKGQKHPNWFYDWSQHKLWWTIKEKSMVQSHFVYLPFCQLR